ncbi:hypothetical protein [Stratiformator vulcanicus]|uniref:Uncharacterized protein n=1 Tax=Stratiformator vulcanicus TaxID=2527980 RepID=A0A517R4Y5_9PLAN|nr:hypothetical protein [Stratiformator vulcanicus]QDT38947.1 hypothetical protein Pan189_33470 [Stratiformator vulcanicus]
MRTASFALLIAASAVVTSADAHEPVIVSHGHGHGGPASISQQTYPDSVPYGGYGPGGYEPRSGKPYYWTGDGKPGMGSPQGDPYTYHFGPGYYRNNEFGHYRFPYYSYRRPWYDVGHPIYVRDTNQPW